MMILNIFPVVHTPIEMLVGMVLYIPIKRLYIYSFVILCPNPGYIDVIIPLNLCKV